MDCVVGIDIGGTNIRIGTVWNSLELSNFTKKSSTFLINPNAPEELYREIKNYIIENELSENIIALTIGVPSCVSKDKSFIYSTPNLKGLENIDLGNFLMQRLNIPVFIDRDVNYLLINDIYSNRLDLERKKTILGMYLGTGFGNAIYINGDLFIGKNGVAGELGHVPLYGVDNKCNCGNIGCVETRVSGKYLTKIKDDFFPNTKISDVFKYHKDEKIIDKFIEDLSIVIATEINILDPDYVILAGGVIAMDSFPIKRLKKYIKQKLRTPYPADNIEYVLARHNQESGVLGGAIYAYDNLV